MFIRLNYSIISILLFFFVVACQSKKETNSSEQPNIIIFLTDDMGYGDLGCYGNPIIKTPNIDHLADQGIRFTSFVTGSWCVPSRTQLLTGRYMARVDFGGKTGADGEGGLPESELTLAEGLKQAGYATGMAGKWHLGYKKKKFLPPSQGFDSWLGLPYSNDYKKPYVQTDVPLVMYRDTTVVEYPVNQDSLTVKYTDEAIRFIQKHSGSDHPFFFYLAYNMPHLPIHTTKAFFGKSGAGLYGDVVETIDWSVGQVLQTLAQEELMDNTIVFFASDNGPWTNAPARMFKLPKHPEGENWELRGPGNKHWYTGSAGPLRGAKGTTYEGGERVPAMIRWPSHIGLNQVSHQLVSSLDIYRTFLEVAGAELPDHKLDGYNLLPFLTGQAEKSPREEYAYFHGAGDELQAMREGEWKLRLAGKEPQLFNLNIDPGEHYNRAEAKPEIVKRIRQRMIQFANEVGVKISQSRR